MTIPRAVPDELGLHEGDVPACFQAGEVIVLTCMLPRCGRGRPASAGNTTPGRAGRARWGHWAGAHGHAVGTDQDPAPIC